MPDEHPLARMVALDEEMGLYDDGATAQVRLKPCPNPFCVAISPPLPAFSTRSETWRVVCGCGIRSFGSDSAADAIAAWNIAHRPMTPDAVARVVAWLRFDLDEWPDYVSPADIADAIERGEPFKEQER